MYCYRNLVATGFLCISIPLHAATTRALGGGSGLGLMRSAEIMPAGESALYLNVGAAEYPLSSGEDALVSDGGAGFAVSIGGHSELDLLFSGATLSSASLASDDSGVRDGRVVFRHSLSEPLRLGDDSAVVLTLYSTVYKGDAADRVSSGESLRGFEINYSRWSGNTGMHFNLGHAYEDAWQGGASPGFVGDHLATMALGLEHNFSRELGWAVQAQARRRSDMQENATVLGGFLRYTPSPRTAVSLGATIGMPDKQAEPDRGLYINMVLGGDVQRQSRYIEPVTFSRLRSRNEELEANVHRLQARVGELEERLQTYQQSPAVAVGAESGGTESAIAIEIIDASGTAGLADKVAERLRGMGYRIAGRRTVAGASQQKSTLYYREGHSAEALELGHRIEGTQTLLRGKLEGDLTLRLLLGRDLADIDSK